MTITAKRIAAGEGWSVDDLDCRAGPADRPFEEQHATIAIAAVLSGTFVYRTHQGSALMAPGSILLGNRGRCFSCGHDHGVGDRCVSFHFTQDYWEDVAAGAPGVRTCEFARPSLPPAAALLPFVVRLAATPSLDPAACEEIGLELAAACLQMSADTPAAAPRRRARDEKRISDAVRRIESQAHDLDGVGLTLAALAREAGMSRYHFLRTFRDLVGATPHQYVLRTRMRRAAGDLGTTDLAVTDIAFAAGFADLSTFCRQFRAVMGAGPGAYRKSARRPVRLDHRQPAQ